MRGSKAHTIDDRGSGTRREAVEMGLGGVGGFAELTTVSRDGVTQRIIDRWPGDEIGGPLHPVPNDWTAWRRLNPAPR